MAKHLFGDLVKIRRFKDLCCEFPTDEYGEGGMEISIWPFFTQYMEEELSGRARAIEYKFYNSEGERTVYSIGRWILVDEFLEEGDASGTSGS